ICKIEECQPSNRILSSIMDHLNKKQQPIEKVKSSKKMNAKKLESSLSESEEEFDRKWKKTIKRKRSHSEQSDSHSEDENNARSQSSSKSTFRRDNQWKKNIRNSKVNKFKANSDDPVMFLSRLE